MSTSKRSLFLLPLLVGCYTYTPIEPSAVPVGAEVRAVISGAASDRIAPIIGQFNQRVLTGKVDENSAGSMTLEVQTGALLNSGTAVVPLTQRVPLAGADVLQLTTRKLNSQRTGFLVGAIAASVAVASYIALQSGGGGSSNGDTGGGGGPPINRIPVIRLKF